MLHRRTTALVVALPLAAALTSCGFDYPTDRVNTIAAGVNDRDASVDVLGARVLAFADGEGRLIGTFVNNEGDGDPASLESVEGTEHGVQVTPGLEIPPNAAVNLAAEDAEPVEVSGEFVAGDVIPLVYTFSTGEVVSVEVPVVKPCGQYADIAGPELEAPAATSEETDASSEEADATYTCAGEDTGSAPEEEAGH